MDILMRKVTGQGQNVNALLQSVSSELRNASTCMGDSSTVYWISESHQLSYGLLYVWFLAAG